MSDLKIIAWLCHKSYVPGFMMDPPEPAVNFVTMDKEVARIYGGKALVLLEDVNKKDK